MPAKDITNHPLTISTGQKIMGLVLAIIMGTISIGGTYLVFKATTDLRLIAVEQQAAKVQLSVDRMEQTGHPDHERRIIRLEGRIDDQQKSISKIEGKLDTVTEILMRVEKKMDGMDARDKR